MKFKIILLIGFVLIVCTFALFTKRSTYYSNSGEKVITEKFFDFECKRMESGDRMEKLEINFNFHPSAQETLRQLSVIPIRNNRDTLKMETPYTNSSYVFLMPTIDPIPRLDLMINYKVDSAGFIINKSAKYYNLEKIHTYSFQGRFN